VDLTGNVRQLGTLVEPTLPDGSGGGLYKININTAVFPTGEG
jgi:hypothetical protein